jgi:hypothetical protein
MAHPSPLHTLSILVVLFHFQCASAATWYFARYWTPSSAQFTSFTGTMTIPRLPKAGVYYLWPGLQPADDTGVLQNVLDGRSGAWWIGSGWCCENPKLSWGDGFNVNQGDTVQFQNVKSGNDWRCSLRKTSTGETVSNTFPLGESLRRPVLLVVTTLYRRY